MDKNKGLLAVDGCAMNGRAIGQRRGVEQGNTWPSGVVCCGSQVERPLPEMEATNKPGIKRWWLSQGTHGGPLPGDRPGPTSPSSTPLSVVIELGFETVFKTREIKNDVKTLSVAVTFTRERVPSIARAGKQWQMAHISYFTCPGTKRAR
ncbi:hypothetical protein EYF80_016926 [Liparis tanakae]|uniref:Uncharacterized protein n=1 Tax=Liparis tanakae TaxID=230148 RepID=A0A4Z2I5T3_9TELE|nr:hypothetical protein EYF80_016926 [Liparis tanakae]